MIVRKSPAEVEIMARAGKVVADLHEILREAVRPGISTADLDAISERELRSRGAIPSFKGYRGFPATLCTSINSEIVHGIPSAKRILRDGDLVKIDCGAIFKGWQGDAAVTAIVGSSHNGATALVDTTREALARGIEATLAGGHVSDIGDAIERFAQSRGYGVVREYCGHGIGRELHEEPAVPNYGPRGQGPRLRPGMVVCIEPMLNAGTGETKQERDGWTVRTADGRLSAHFEHTVAVTESGPRVLTLP